MGFFSKKRKVTVATSVVRVMEDKTVPNAVLKGTLTGIMRGENIPENILESLIDSVGIKADRMYDYAEKHYTYGTPSGDIVSNTKGRNQVQELLNNLEGTAVSMVYSYFGPSNNLHVGWLQLANDYGYTAGTNELTVLSAQKGHPVYLKDMVVAVPPAIASGYDPSAFAQWDVSPNGGYTPARVAGSPQMGALIKSNLPVVDASLSVAMVKVSYVWKVGTVINEAVLMLTLGEYDDDPNADYFQAKYIVNNVVKYWIYHAGSGKHPTLDQLFNGGATVQESGSYFPFVHFRNNKTPTNGNKNSAAYKTSKKLVDYLGMDFDTVTDAINSNPGIGDVQQAMMMMAVPAASTNLAESEYLFRYFENMYYATPVVPKETTPWSIFASGFFGGSNAYVTPTTAVAIQDGLFRMALSNDGITRRRRGGVIGKVGTYTSAFMTLDGTELTTQYNQDTGGAGGGLFGGIIQMIKRGNKHVYRKQVTSNMYDEFVVSELRMVYNVFEGYTTVGNDNDAILLIPIDRSISRAMGLPAREELYSRSLHMVFNSVVITYTKWYQTGFFKLFMFVVAVILSIPSGGTSLALYLGITSAVGIIMVTVVMQLVLQAVLPAVFKMFVKAVGKDIAIFTAVAAVMYGGYKYFTSVGVTGAPFASTMLQVSSGLYTAVLEEKFSDLLYDVNSFDNYMKQQTKLLDEANNLLEVSHFLSPFVIFGESPDDFYNRTIHAGNVGVLGISAISNYVDIALTLPKAADTLDQPGEDNNVRNWI